MINLETKRPDGTTIFSINDDYYVLVEKRVIAKDWGGYYETLTDEIITNCKQPIAFVVPNAQQTDPLSFIWSSFEEQSNGTTKITVKYARTRYTYYTMYIFAEPKNIINGLPNYGIKFSLYNPDGSLAYALGQKILNIVGIATSGPGTYTNIGNPNFNVFYYGTGTFGTLKESGAGIKDVWEITPAPAGSLYAVQIPSGRLGTKSNSGNAWTIDEVLSIQYGKPYQVWGRENTTNSGPSNSPNSCMLYGRYATNYMIADVTGY